MEDLFGKYILFEGNIISFGKADNFKEPKGKYVYEVIRVISGIPLFLEEHLERLSHSVSKAGHNFLLDFETIKEQLMALILKNDLSEGNLKILIGFETNPGTTGYIIPQKYPTDQEYKEGATLGLLNRERTNPEAKIVQKEIRDRANELIREKNCYEVLLVNNEGDILEGSRSNVFFIKSNRVYTAPKQKVLSGITRQKVLEILKNNRIDFEENAVNVNELGQYEAVFITGTSPKVLPVRRIKNFYFSTRHIILQKVALEYDQLISEYIAAKIK